LRVEGILRERLVCARAGPPVGGLFYRSLGGILHNRFTERSTALALNVSQLFAPIPIRCRRYDSVRGGGHSSVQVGYPKSQQRTSRVLKSPEVTPLAVAKPNSCPSKAPATGWNFCRPPIP